MAKSQVLIPFEGTTSLKLGMTVDEVEAMLGKSDLNRPNSNGERRNYRPSVCRRILNVASVSVGFSTEGKAVDFGFAAPGILIFAGENLLKGSNQISLLMKHDQHPMMGCGFVVFYEIGIWLATLVGNRPGVEAIGVSQEGVWDRHREKMTPYQPSA